MLKDDREKGKNVNEQARLVMLKLLRELDRICTKYDIPYWLDGGTLLGAIRHGGFIPWDDDIDVAMLRNDYYRFLEVAKTELRDDIYLQTRETDSDYPMFFAKLRDKYSTFHEPMYERLKCHKGIFLDIFPFDYVKHSWWQSHLKLFLHDTNYSVVRHGAFLQRTVGYLMKRFIRYSHIPLYNWLNDFFHAETMEEADSLAWAMEINEYKLLSKDVLFPLKRHEFEGEMFNIPCNYDTYLREYFGDYMQLPPLNKRVRHNNGIDFYNSVKESLWKGRGKWNGACYGKNRLQMKRITSLHCSISCWYIPFPRGKMCTVLPLIRSVVDKCWNGKKFLDCLTDRRKWKSFYRNYVREMRSLWNWQNWGMTIFPQKNLSAKKIIAIHYKHKSTSFHGL